MSKPKLHVFGGNCHNIYVNALKSYLIAQTDLLVKSSIKEQFP